MEEKKPPWLSCVDCHVFNCHYQDSKYPDFCPTRLLTKILRINGFEVVGAVCKAGATPKVEIGIPQECDAVGVNMCNPVLQAELLNDAGTELNLIMGLCVGHDSLFIKHSNALCTSVVTKDRVLGHNPAAAIYCADSYFKTRNFIED